MKSFPLPFVIGLQAFIICYKKMYKQVVVDVDFTSMSDEGRLEYDMAILSGKEIDYWYKKWQEAFAAMEYNVIYSFPFWKFSKSSYGNFIKDGMRKFKTNDFMQNNKAINRSHERYYCYTYNHILNDCFEYFPFYELEGYRRVKPEDMEKEKIPKTYSVVKDSLTTETELSRNT